MTTIGQISVAQAVVRRTDRPVPSLRYDYAMMLTIVWLVGGFVLDAWAHSHFGKDLETFFTPWHAALYSGFGAVFTLTIGTLFWNIRRGYDWRAAMPSGYELSLFGGGLFFIGGIGDLIWHTLFGIEQGIDAAFSPTHQILVIATATLAFGPLRSALRKDDTASSYWRFLPALTSSVAGFILMLLILQSANIFAYPYPTIRFTPTTLAESNSFLTLGIVGAVVEMVALMGTAFFLIRRWAGKLPFATFTTIFTVIGLVIATQKDQYLFVPAMVLGGLVADSLIRWLRPSAERTGEVRLFAMIVPMMIYISYFVIMAFTSKTWWSMHVIGGVVVAAAGTSLLLSYLT